MIFNINSTRGQMRFLPCVALVTCLVCIVSAIDLTLKAADHNINEVTFNSSADHPMQDMKRLAGIDRDLRNSK